MNSLTSFQHCPDPQAFYLVWLPIVSRVGTIEIEHAILDEFPEASYLGVSNYLIDPEYPRSALLPRSIIRSCLYIRPLLGGRLSTLAQSLFAIPFILRKLFLHKYTRVVFISLLFPLPLLLLGSLISRFTSIQLVQIVLVQGTPSFQVSSLYLVPLSSWRYLESRLRVFVFKYLYKSASSIVVSSYRLRSLFLDFGFSEANVKLLPNGVVSHYNHTSTFSTPHSSQFHITKPINIVLIGRHTYQKNLIPFLTYLTDAGLQNLSISRIELYGSGELTAALSDKFKSHSQILIHGHVSNPWDHIEPGSLIVVPSLWEEPGHVILEALQRNYMVLFSQNCSFSDFLSPKLRTLLTFDPRNFHTLFSNLSVRTDPLLWHDSSSELRSVVHSFTKSAFRAGIRRIIGLHT